MRVDCVTCPRDYIDCVRFGSCLKEVTKDTSVSLCDLTTTDSDEREYNSNTETNKEIEE